MIRTAFDARTAKRNADARRFGASEARDIAAAARRAEIDAVLASNPAIGELCRKGRPVFYAFVAGQLIEATTPEAIAAELAA